MSPPGPGDEAPIKKLASLHKAAATDATVAGTPPVLCAEKAPDSDGSSEQAGKPSSPL